MNHIIGPGSERKKIKIYNSPAEYFKSQEFENDQRLKEDQTNSQNDLEQKIKQKEGYVYVPSLKLYVSEEVNNNRLTWNNTQKLLHQQGKRMPTIFEFAEFLKYLKSDDGKRVVKNVNKILDYIYLENGIDRFEYLDAYFTIKKDRVYCSYFEFDKLDNFVKNTTLVEDCQLQNKVINFEEWINNHTKEGLPKPNCSQGGLSYQHPEDGCVAMFGKVNFAIILFCKADPDLSTNYPGFRSVEIGDPK